MLVLADKIFTLPKQKDWWKRPASCRMNTKRKTKRKILKPGSIDLYLLKRTIELESDSAVAIFSFLPTYLLGL